MVVHLTGQHARALGIAIPADPRPVIVADGMNKTERAFRDSILEPARSRREIVDYWREPVKLRLAGHTWYCADFLVMEPAGFTFVEIKGYLRDDASVKIKVAAAQYPCARFLLVYRRRGEWIVREVTARGIGVQDVPVPWIHGG